MPQWQKRGSRGKTFDLQDTIAGVQTRNNSFHLPYHLFLIKFQQKGEKFNEVVGSPYYVAPEVLQKDYSQECDIWSAGVIIYILLSGVPPFWDESEQGIFEQVLSGEVDFESEPWPMISDSAKDLVRKMLEKDVKKRLTAHEVLCFVVFSK